MSSAEHPRTLERIDQLRSKGADLVNLAVTSSTLATIRHAAFAVALGINAGAVVLSMLIAWALTRKCASREKAEG